MRTLVSALSLLSLTACSLAPPYERPVAPVPATWPTGPSYLQQREATLPAYDYRTVFPDPRLQTLISRALAYNQDVALAVANVAAARAQYRIQRADLLPQVDISANYARTGGKGATQSGDRFSLQGGVTGYELDLFSRIRSLTGAARSRYTASESAARAARLSVVSDVVDAWLVHAADQSLLDLARRTATTANESVALTRKRVDGGIAPRTDLRQAQIAATTAQQDEAAKTTAVAQDVNALQLLVGAPIDPALLSNSIDDAGSHIAEIPAGIDSTVLLRRPDVLEAEWQLRAANADIGAARAALFPKISLTGLLGLASSALGALFTGGAFSFTAGANVGYSLFNGGAGRANVALSEAQRDAAIAVYRKAIESAFADVADALAQEGTIYAQIAIARAQDAAASDNFDLEALRYRSGIDSYLGELTARQALYAAQKTVVNVELLRASNRVAIYRALGADAAL